MGTEQDTGPETGRKQEGAAAMSSGKTRSIFQDVDEEQGGARPQAQGGMIDAGRGGARRGVRLWLMLIFALVVLMISVGGLTRLTDSGLSITQWKPVTGALPPMTTHDWQQEFDRYQQIPEYKLQNKGMSLSDFKYIYWWEWSHRQLGRVIGLVWGLGYLGFLLARKIPPGWKGKLLLPGVLGGVQGAIGWWMVSSGLTGTMLDVASYRLATHLGLAFAILGLIAWFVFQLGQPERELIQRRRGRIARAWGFGSVLTVAVFVQILMGALVAGIDAGRAYTDWPWMAGGFLPPDPMSLSPWWRNFFEDPGLVQFVHRMTGYTVAILGILAWAMTRRVASQAVRGAFSVVLAMIAVQVTLGILTVIYIAPWHLAIVHQLSAVALWVVILRARFMGGYPPVQSVRGAR